MDITYTFARGEEREVKSIHQWVHTAGEIMRLLRGAGLEPVDTYGDVESAPFGLGSPRLIALARRT
jgi:hypothetical protein